MNAVLANNSGIFCSDYLRKNRSFHALLVVALEQLNVDSSSLNNVQNNADKTCWFDEKMRDDAFVAEQRQAEIYWTDLAAKKNCLGRKRKLCVQQDDDAQHGEEDDTVGTSERVFAKIVEKAKKEAKRAVMERGNRACALSSDTDPVVKKRKVAKKPVPRIRPDNETYNELNDEESKVFVTANGRLAGSWKMPTLAMLESEAYCAPHGPDDIFVWGKWRIPYCPMETIMESAAYKAPHPPGAIFLFEEIINEV